MKREPCEGTVHVPGENAPIYRLFDLEQEFSIPIQAEDMLNVKSVGNLVDFLGEGAS